MLVICPTIVGCHHTHCPHAVPHKDNDYCKGHTACPNCVSIVMKEREILTEGKTRGNVKHCDISEAPVRPPRGPQGGTGESGHHEDAYEWLLEVIASPEFKEMFMRRNLK